MCRPSWALLGVLLLAPFRTSVLKPNLELKIYILNNSLGGPTSPHRHDLTHTSVLPVAKELKVYNNYT